MGVHDNVLEVIVIEEVIPGVDIEVECIVEDELQVWSLVFHHGMNFTIKSFKKGKIR